MTDTYGDYMFIEMSAYIAMDADIHGKRCSGVGLACCAMITEMSL